MLFRRSRARSVATAAGCEERRINATIDRTRQQQLELEISPRLAELAQGHEFQAQSGMDLVPCVGNSEIQMLAGSGRIDEARAAFDRLPSPSVISWNAMISAYARSGNLDRARELFDKMPDRSVVTWNAMIRALAGAGDAQGAIQLFRTMILQGERPVRATILSALAIDPGLAAVRFLHGVVAEAGLGSEIAVSTALVAALGKCAKIDEAFAFFQEMRHRNIVSWASILGVLTNSEKLPDARALFDRMPCGNVVSWNTMIGGYARSGHSHEALAMLLEMDLEGVEPDHITLAAALEACSQLADLAQGQRIHASIASISDMGVGNALINLYGRCGRMDLARGCFDFMIRERIVRRNSIPWTSIVGHYARNGYPAQAMELFHAMAAEGFYPSSVLFISILAACSHGGKLEDARSFFQSMISDFGLDPAIDHYMCVLDLLGRTGRLDDAHDLVQAVDLDAQSEELMAWRTMIAACKSQGEFLRGRIAVENAVGADEAAASTYVVLASMYREEQGDIDGADGAMWQDASR